MTSFRGSPLAHAKAFLHVLGRVLLLGAASWAIPLSALACTADNECTATGHCRRLGDYPQVSPISDLMPGQCYSATDTGIVNNSGSPACNDAGAGTQAAPYCQISAAINANKKYIFVGASGTPYAGFSISSGPVAVLGPTRDATMQANPLAQVGQVQLSGASLLLYGLKANPTTSVPGMTCSGANSNLTVWSSVVTSNDRGIDATGCANLDVEQTRISSNKSGIVIIGSPPPQPATTYRIANVAAATGGINADPWGVYIGMNTSANSYFAFNTITNYINGVTCSVNPMVFDNSIVAGNTMLQVSGCNPTARVITSGVTLMPGPEPKIDASQTCCVNKAVPDATAPNVDYYGTARPQGGGYDIGYFEVPVSFTVTPSAGPNGTISPATPQTVNGGTTTNFTVTPNAGFVASVAGTCGGTLIGTTYTTHPITADCTVVASFAATYPVTTVVSPSGGGTITCAPNPVISGNTTTCTAVAAGGYALSSMSGCGGTPGPANPYTTGAITAACTVTANFTANPINGACGAANGTQSLFAPRANLCSAGSASSVVSSGGQYSWTCNGANGGGSAYCYASWANTPSGGKASASVSGATCTAQSGSIAAAANVPSNLRFPEGALNFTLSGCTPGGTANMTVQYTHALSAGAQYYKEIGANWSIYPGAVVGSNTVTFGITDNGAQDSDPTPGTITDPSGPAVIAATPPPPATIGAPALSPLALLLLSGLLGGTGWAMWRWRIHS